MAIDDNASYELTGYQVKDLASKIRAKADSNSLASVATSGLYSDLTGAPTIPTVYNGTLTIQQNGTTLGTFSANQSANETINITAGGGSSSTTFYVDDVIIDSANVSLYHDSELTSAATYGEVASAIENGEVCIRYPLVDFFYYPTAAIVAHSSGTVSLAITVGSFNTNNTYTLTMSGVTETDPFYAPVSENSYTMPTASSGTLGGVKVGSNLSISSGVLSANAMTGATSGTDGASGYVPAPAAGDQDKVLKGDGTWGNPQAQLVEMSYGESNAWAKFLAAYQAKSIVYCSASSNANPGTGAKTRRAFMAYVNDETTPTEVEFQYVRSVGSKTSSQPVDQVFVYKLTSSNGGTWSVQTRDMAPKLAAGTGASVNYSSGTYTVEMSAMSGATSSADGSGGSVPTPVAGDQDKVLKADATWGKVGANNIDFTTMPVYTDSKSNVALSTSYTTLAKVTVGVPGKYLLLLDASSNSISSSYSLYSRFAIDTSTYNGNYVTVPGGGWGHTSNMCVVDISTANTDVKAEFNSTGAIAASPNTRVNLTAIRIG